MVRELHNNLSVKIFLMLTLFAVIILITGCGSTTSNAQRKYFTGYNSVEMRFLEDTPPSIFYYDSTATDPEVNTIPISVEVYNKGSSSSYGALFIHGFDPNVITVEGYTKGFLGYSDALVRGGLGTMFSTYFGPDGKLAVGEISVPIGGKQVSLNFANIAGQKAISFSSFGYSDRYSLFNALHFQVVKSTYTGYTGVSVGVLNSPVGAVLNPITMGLFSNFGWGDWLKKFALEGRNDNNPGGGMDVVDFPARIISLPASLEEFTQPIMITSCFDYVTHASTMVCLDPEPYSNAVRKACVPTTVSPGGGQGAPVAVTTIEQRPGKGRTTFVINIHLNKEDTYDELFDYFSLYKCDPATGQSVKTNDLNIVYVGYVYLSNYDITMSCMPDQVMRLDDSGNGQITCSIAFPPGTSTSAYKADLEVELWYGYSKTIRKDIIIRRQ